MDLIQRVRWANVARLVLAVAAGLLIAVGPHGCGPRQEQVAPPPREVVPDPAPKPAPRSTGPEVPRPRPHHRRKRKHQRQGPKPAPAIRNPQSAIPRAPLP